MPVVSKAQNAAMHAAAAGKSTLGIPKSVGRDFTANQGPGALAGLPQHVGASSRDHSLSMASANHLHSMGHITTEHRDRIHAAAKAGIAKSKQAPSAPMGWAPPRGDSDRDGM